MTVQKRVIMKTCSRSIFAPLILAALLLAMAVSAQETSAKQQATTTKQRPSTVLERQATTKATQTQTQNPSKKPPSNRGGVYLPDGNRQRPKEDYQPVYSRMPNLIGMDGKEAGLKLRRDAPGVRLVAHRADTHVSNYSVGVVVSQSRAAGTELRPRISVMIYLNPQPPVSRMPNLVGLNVSSATETLRREIPNIPYRREMAPSNNPKYVEGVVVSQYPAAGTEMGRGIEVVLSFNPRPTATPTVTPTLGPTVAPTVIPTLGPTPASNVTPTLGPTPASNVTPIQGPTVAPNVTLTLVVVPDVRKKELTEAISLLRAAQLNVGAVTKKDTKETANSVLEQQPLPGQQVAVASSIDLVIGKQPETGGLITEPLKILGVIALGFFAFLLGGLWKRFRSKPGEARANFNTLNIPP